MGKQGPCYHCGVTSEFLFLHFLRKKCVLQFLYFILFVWYMNMQIGWVILWLKGINYVQKANELRIWAVLLCDFACVWILKHSCLVYLNWYCFQFQFVIASKYSVFLVWLSITVFNLFQSWVWTLHQIVGNHFVNIRLRNSSSWTICMNFLLTELFNMRKK